MLMKTSRLIQPSGISLQLSANHHTLRLSDAKKRPDSRAEAGCTNCSADSTCKDDCECRGLYMSCSKNCHCSDMCTNKPFRKDKKIKAVKTKRCGWGAISLEPLEKGDFIIEYVGEVINDATCEQRLWDMKRRGDKHFYMCEISKDFTIDATFKGNTSRFLNHSCDPNCKLEKWQVDGETRVGVFASRSIQVGEHLTYDYRYSSCIEKLLSCNQLWLTMI
uniref:SET domain-containing protein n=1 Tax=Oryza glaberrima TaxID=4538 RepID=I1P250_ORYGL